MKLFAVGDHSSLLDFDWFQEAGAAVVPPRLPLVQASFKPQDGWCFGSAKTASGQGPIASLLSAPAKAQSCSGPWATNLSQVRHTTPMDLSKYIYICTYPSKARMALLCHYSKICPTCQDGRMRLREISLFIKPLLRVSMHHPMAIEPLRLTPPS